MTSLTALFAFLSLVTLAYSTDFNPLHHSGPASPYFNAPSQFGVPPSTPAQCKVDQAAYIVRHGSEAFDLGMELRKRYRFTKGGDNFTVWSAGQQRVVDTATYFTLGYLSQGNYLSAPGTNRGQVVTTPDSVNFTFADSLTPSTACPLYSQGDTSAKATTFRGTYQGNIANRLNKFLDGLALDATDIGVMQDLCGFQAEVDGDTRFCDIFDESEWLDYEYAHDLNYYYGSGPGNPFSATVGYPWLKAITELFSSDSNRTQGGGNFVPPPLIMSFTHDNNLPPIVSALGVWNSSALPDVYPLSTVRANPDRTFRSSFLVSFRGYIALERMSCDAHEPPTSVTHTSGQVALGPGASASAQKYVRLRINNAVVPLPGCATGPGASCSLAAFENYVRSRAEVAGDFVARCGLQDVKNATNTLDIFTNVPSELAQSTVLVVPLPYAGLL
ncbi:hypothetical protein GSI_10601 [Ganoderma sinense ZZ0214-1]|uniref:Phosphoglycerate mutase-like protein n=1 Tax=Ganoderma sinense ZZ0214-1 TaxID=1077348 RepID=A0A2G8S104_9APHY|nr:hypothetical protein GSI_10601 [Ganoderma sinense ZZ0214-1]